MSVREIGCWDVKSIVLTSDGIIIIIIIIAAAATTTTTATTNTITAYWNWVFTRWQQSLH